MLSGRKEFFAEKKVGDVFMKVFKKILFITLIAVFVLTLAACGNNKKKPDTPITPGERTGTDLTPDSIAQLRSLIDYSSRQSYYEKGGITFSGNTYAGQNCDAQITKLQARITQKQSDVNNWKTISSAVKIFAKSTPEGLLTAMAKAALSYDEMSRVVEYLYGSAENPDLDSYLKENEDGTWSNTFTGKTTTWRNVLRDDGKIFNEGWSLFDDWDMYDRLKDYAKSNQLKKAKDGTDNNKAARENAEDNASWQYRSILKKVYTQVQLDGDAAARLATYMLEYAIKIVEEQPNSGKVENALNQTGNGFATYCKKVPVRENGDDPFTGLGDYETLSYLLAFNSYYHKSEGLKNCVKLYGYYYDYNKTYYFETLADEDTYAKQLKYERQDTYSSEEWLEYVAIQRNNYVKAYRYTEDIYRLFYTIHFDFQQEIESFDDSVYEVENVIRDVNALAYTSTAIKKANTTYTKEMRLAIQKTTALNGLAGQLAMSDWTWCYGGNRDAMLAYNDANTLYENGKASDDTEAEYHGKFQYEKEQLKMTQYLLQHMTEMEKAGALYYNVYAYSASMVKSMQTDIKNIVYIRDGVEKGEKYTSISKEVLDRNSDSESNEYAKGKITVLYYQTYDSWERTGVTGLANNATGQNWPKIQEEIAFALNYNYDGMQIKSGEGEWKKKCERLEDLVVMRKWSCCEQLVHEADPTQCKPGARHGVYNTDGTAAKKDYDTSHAISLFAKNYENVILHIAGNAKFSFQKPESGFQTNDQQNKSWTAGYYGTFSELYKSTMTVGVQMKWAETKALTLSTGDSFVQTIKGDDKGWWEGKTGTPGAKDGTDNDTKFPYDAAADIRTEDYGSKVNYAYTYTFKNWYLDKECKYEFDENDDIEVNLNIYAGYNVSKSAQ